jgi:hypothetical protein
VSQPAPCLLLILQVTPGPHAKLLEYDLEADTLRVLAGKDGSDEGQLEDGYGRTGNQPGSAEFQDPFGIALSSEGDTLFVTEGWAIRQVLVETPVFVQSEALVKTLAGPEQKALGFKVRHKGALLNA